MSTYHQKLQEYFHRYETERSQGQPTQLTDVAAWMIENKLWKIRPADIIQRCADELSRALREEYKMDEKGRRYRVNHAVRSKQGTFWAVLDSAPRSHMEKAFAQRRRQVVGDCVQLKTDVDVYNDKHSDSMPINLVLDFTDDVEEVQALRSGSVEDEAA